MKTVSEARAIILDGLAPLGSERVPLVAAAGRMVAHSVEARRNLPPWDNSAMDGYAVRTEDVAAASADMPVTLDVVGTVAAGAVVKDLPALAAGQAVRIMTGAPVPPSATAVVMREQTDEAGNDGTSGTVAIQAAVRVGQNIRRMGEDVADGRPVAQPGDLVTPARLNLIASAGHASVAVVRKPRVAVLASGDELADVGEPLGPDSIVNSNAHALVAACRAAGCDARFLGIARDTVADHVAYIEAAADADILITIGGVSVGDRDPVRPALEQAGVDIALWKVAMRPGKPLAFGRKTRGPGSPVQLVFGLPGNPVSSLVAFEQWVRPAVRSLLGQPGVVRRFLRATAQAAQPFKKRPGVEFYVRVRVEIVDGALVAHVGTKQSSGQISGLAEANALLRIPSDATQIADGDACDVWLLDERALFA